MEPEEEASKIDQRKKGRCGRLYHTVKGFGIVNKAEIDGFLELSCFFDDPVVVGNLISCFSAFSKTSLNIWKFTVHVLLKPACTCTNISIPSSSMSCSNKLVKPEKRVEGSSDLWPVVKSTGDNLGLQRAYEVSVFVCVCVCVCVCVLGVGAVLVLWDLVFSLWDLMLSLSR